MLRLRIYQFPLRSLLPSSTLFLLVPLFVLCQPLMLVYHCVYKICAGHLQTNLVTAMLRKLFKVKEVEYM